MNFKITINEREVQTISREAIVGIRALQFAIDGRNGDKFTVEVIDDKNESREKDYVQKLEEWIMENCGKHPPTQCERCGRCPITEYKYGK